MGDYFTMADKTITCKECKQTFVFTEAEQAFYEEKGFQNEPQRCPDCRAEYKRQRRGGGFGGGQREMFPVTCAACGKETTVPFRPTTDKPVYCKDCFQARGGR